jgi:hypothetical protein
MVRKTKKGWAVFSSKGKKLSRDYKTKKAATARLGEIEHFKRKK